MTYFLKNFLKKNGLVNSFIIKRTTWVYYVEMAISLETATFFLKLFLADSLFFLSNLFSLLFLDSFFGIRCF